MKSTKKTNYYSVSLDHGEWCEGEVVGARGRKGRAGLLVGCALVAL